MSFGRRDGCHLVEKIDVRRGMDVRRKDVCHLVEEGMDVEGGMNIKGRDVYHLVEEMDVEGRMDIS